MFKHILVPTDFTDQSLKAIDIAIRMALRDVNKVTLLHVIETIADADSEEFDVFYDKLAKRAQNKLGEMARRYDREDLVIHTEIMYGKRAIEIVKFARENAVDLIVLSSHKIDRKNALGGWGTISYKVGILSHCPVMLVK
jgi:nucleotide-binding universal stress UspA family protein